MLLCNSMAVSSCIFIYIKLLTVKQVYILLCGVFGISCCTKCKNYHYIFWALCFNRLIYPFPQYPPLFYFFFSFSFLWGRGEFFLNLSMYASILYWRMISLVLFSYLLEWTSRVFQTMDWHCSSTQAIDWWKEAKGWSP